jgi:hypothetical protein
MPAQIWHLWTADEWALAKSLFEQGMDYQQIAAGLRKAGYTRSVGSIQGKCFNASMYRGQRRQPKRLSKFDPARADDRPTPFDSQIIERDARREASYRRSIGAELMGDPPVGFSALDRRK